MPSNYNINKSNQNYVNALVKYCKDEPIYSVTYVSDGDQINRDLSKKNITCKDLPSLFSTIRSNEFTISCGSSLRSVLPEVDSAKLLVATPEVSNDEMSLITDNNIFQGYFNWVVECALTGIETYCSPEGPSKKLVSLRPNLNKTEAILLLQQIDEFLRTGDKSQHLKNARQERVDRVKDFLKITNMLFMPQQETFVFCVANETYYLRYGNQPKFDVVDGLAFDMDDGFMVARWPEDAAKKAAFITNELNARFNRWKNNNYKGDFIADNESGLTESNSSTVVSSSGMFARASNQPQQQEKRVNAFKY